MRLGRRSQARLDHQLLKAARNDGYVPAEDAPVDNRPGINTQSPPMRRWEWVLLAMLGMGTAGGLTWAAVFLASRP